VAALVDSMQQAVQPYVSRVVGEAARKLRGPALANLVTDAMRSTARADVAIANPGGLRRDLEAGPITMGTSSS
jgi:5'-nucleotidase